MGQIRRFNREAVAGGKQQIDFAPEVHSIRVAPKQGEDWLPKLNFRNIKQQILGAASSGYKSPIHGPNPISSYIFGREMDQGEGTGWKY